MTDSIFVFVRRWICSVNVVTLQQTTQVRNYNQRCLLLNLERFCFMRVSGRIYNWMIRFFPKVQLYVVHFLHLCSNIPLFIHIMIQEIRLILRTTLFCHKHLCTYVSTCVCAKFQVYVWALADWHRLLTPTVESGASQATYHAHNIWRVPVLGRVETMSQSGVRALHSPSVLFSLMPLRLNYTPDARGWDGEYQWFQTSAITTFGYSLWPCLKCSIVHWDWLLLRVVDLVVYEHFQIEQKKGKLFLVQWVHVWYMLPWFQNGQVLT